jgi:hypothetical protein
MTPPVPATWKISDAYLYNPSPPSWNCNHPECTGVSRYGVYTVPSKNNTEGIKKRAWEHAWKHAREDVSNATLNGAGNQSSVSLLIIDKLTQFCHLTGDMGTLKMLLDAEVDVSLPSWHGLNPLYAAASEGVMKSSSASQRQT